MFHVKHPSRATGRLTEETSIAPVAIASAVSGVAAGRGIRRTGRPSVRAAVVRAAVVRTARFLFVFAVEVERPAGGGVGRRRRGLGLRGRRRRRGLLLLLLLAFG